MSWMHGVRVEGRIRGAPTYREGAPARVVIHVRNPPLLTYAAVVSGAAMLVLGAFSLVAAEDTDPVVTGLRTLAPIVGGLAVTAAALRALRPHTIIAIDGERIVVERARSGRGARHPLTARAWLEADPITGDVRARIGDELVVLAPALLPEQAALVVVALRDAVPAR